MPPGSAVQHDCPLYPRGRSIVGGKLALGGALPIIPWIFRTIGHVPHFPSVIEREHSRVSLPPTPEWLAADDGLNLGD